MPSSFGYREDHLLSFFDYANILDLDQRQVFGLSLLGCDDDLYTGTTCVPFIEHKHQTPNRITRMSLSRAIAYAESRISEHLKVKVGPTYVQNEQHALSWPISPRRISRYPFSGHRYSVRQDSGIEVKLNFRGIIAAGTQVLEEIGADITQTRSFADSKGWGFEDDIVFEIGTPNDPLTLTTEQCGSLCNLRIYEEGSNIIGNDPYNKFMVNDTNDTFCQVGEPRTEWEMKRFRHGHRIRPFNAEYDGTTLKICVPKVVAVKHSNYLKLGKSKDKGYLKDLDFCDEDTFIDRIRIFVVNYCNPAGEAILRKTTCSCPTGCDACEPIKVPVCLKPGNPESGFMKVVPITDTNANDPDATECCWVETSWDSCCSPTYCRTPITVCLNYVSSACGCWGDPCIPDEVCPDLKNAVAWLATGLLPDSCTCDCLANQFAYYQEDLKAVITANRNRTLTFADLVFGMTQGALSAYQAVKFYHNVHGSGQYFLG